MNEMRLIDANALKKEIQHLGNANPSYWNKCDVVYRQEVLDEIDSAETVEIPVARWDCYCEGQKVGYEKALSERPQGEWIYHKSDGYFLPYMECSNCKVQDLLENLTKKEYREVNHFCFNCGAKMKGSAE